jgi:hypothetical protein
MEVVMRKAIFLFTCLAFTLPALAQNPDDPATREDVVLLLRTMQSHDMMQRTMEAMVKPMHQMYHQQYVKDKDKLPPDFEARMNKMIDEMMKDMPFDEMMQAMIPAYQKHFTHGDVEALNAFYSSPVGQKFLHETPAVTGEAMQAMVPIMTKYTQQWQDRMQKEIMEMMESTPKQTGQAPSTHN